MFDLLGEPQLDYSGEQLSNPFTDGAYLTTPAYQRAWYAPADSALATDAGVQAATRFCSAQQFGPGQPVQQMARVLSDTLQSDQWFVDWDGDRQPDQALPGQDTNFDGTPDQPFSGFDDWDSIRLDQISANGLGGGIEDFMLVGSSAVAGLGAGDPLKVGADDLISFGGDDLVFLGGDDLIVFGGDDLISFGGDDLVFSAVTTT